MGTMLTIFVLWSTCDDNQRSITLLKIFKPCYSKTDRWSVKP